MCVLRRLFPPRSFAIRQHAASRVLDGAHLLTLLQQASGASNFAKAVAESNVKLEKERESLRGVRTDVAELGHTRHPRPAGPATAEGALSSCMRGAALPVTAGQLKGALCPQRRLRDVGCSSDPPPQSHRALCV